MMRSEVIWEQKWNYTTDPEVKLSKDRNGSSYIAWKHKVKTNPVKCSQNKNNSFENIPEINETL